MKKITQKAIIDNTDVPAALVRAVIKQSGDLERFVRLVKSGADVFKGGDDAPILTACIHGHANIVNYLISQRLIKDLDKQRNALYTPLMLASYHCHPEIVKLLLNHMSERGDVDSIGNLDRVPNMQKRSGIHYATNSVVRYGGNTGTEELRKLAASMNQVVTETTIGGITAIISASIGGSDEVVTTSTSFGVAIK